MEQEEITKFNQLAGEFWREGGAFSALHHINPCRIEFIEQHKILTGMQILDIGCGGGILAESMALLGAEVCGIDLAEQVIEEAKRHAKNNGLDIEYRLIASDKIKDEEKRYDIVTCMDMLEHVDDPALILADAYQLLKNNGYCFISTINRNLSAKILAIGLAEYVMRIVPRGTHSYEHLLKPQELIDMAEAIGFQVKNISGISYNPLLKTARLTRKPTINYLLALQKKDTIAL